MTIDLRVLRDFVAIASAGSISKAAENLHIAQPALSVHMRRLEERVGTTLLERHHRGVKLTSTGERLLQHANEILRHVDVALEDVRRAVAEPTGRVALGLPQSIARELVLPLVKLVLQRWPLVRLQIVEMNTGYIPEHLLKGDIDLGITFGTAHTDGIAYTHLLDEELVFVSSRRQLEQFHPEGGPDWASIRVAELSRFPIILPTALHSLRRRIDESLAPHGIQLEVVAEVNAIPQLIELAAAGVSSTVLSFAAVTRDPAMAELVVSRITEPSLTRPVYLCRSAATPLSIAASIIQEELRAQVGSLLDAGRWRTSPGIAPGIDATV
ncbi:MAG: LysR family transcriptional regulator [Burkholderiaceae bacterium]